MGLLLAGGISACSSDTSSPPAAGSNKPGTGGTNTGAPTGTETGSEMPGGSGTDDPPGGGTGTNSTGTDGTTGPSGTEPGGSTTTPGTTASPTETGTPPPPPAGATECTDPDLIGPTPIRRVSGEEYANAVRDVFQTAVDVGQLPADEKLGIFKTNVVTRLTADHFERYRTLASNVGDDVVANFATLSGCSSSADTACAGTYLAGAARRLFHGTLEEADATRLADLYTEVAATDADLALNTAVQWMLLSPRFLFMVEFGAATGAHSTLSGSEIAGRLAAFFWRTVPDTTLLSAADAGTLDTAEGIRTQADAMLSDARAVPMLKSFGQQLLRIIPPEPGADALDQQKRAEVGEIFAQASTDAELTYGDLIAGENPAPASELGAFYGDEDRRGILLTAGFLASNNRGELPSPVKRGYVIRAGLLCGVVPPPADPTDMQLTDNGMGGSVKDTFNAHANNATCWACHQLMDPIGDAFGQYGANGGFDAALASDTSGTITPGMDAGAYTDVGGLLQLLSEDASAKQCFALQATRFALGRNETKEDACGIKAITDAFAAGSYSVRELLLGVATSTTFTSRNNVVAGGECR
jgi:hypothetical protein